MKITLMCLMAGAMLLGSGRTARAQDWYGAATWQVSIPSGDTKDFVNDTSFGGFGLDFRKMVKPNTTLGFLFGWNVFHERLSGPYTVDNVTITGTQDRYINAYPMMVGVHRYFGQRHATRPYIGVNGGLLLNTQTFDIGIWSVEDTRWDWGIAPEAGVVVPLQSGAAFMINGRYNWSPTSQSLAGNDADLTYWGINVGFVWEQY
ncbi:MAG TPA: hypothetical protein VFX92_08040 [Candidatus Krumholzibacteria bacterium]|nr:hypothetical protein [Candidatus Krumholzibacteria bacterium]